MEDKLFFEHYRICTDADGPSHEVNRTGAAINYRAIDIRSKEPVVLQLVPFASVDPATFEQFQDRARAAQKLDHINISKLLAVGVEHDYIALVSEYVEGETADSWIVTHGPMAADAVLRIGIQVVRALAAAAFFSLTHRAIQPSNIMIAPGQTADGGWPFVKLLNFGLAGLESHSEGAEARELAPSTPPQFASPEQLQNRPLDFRSEIYSLGATMCFLLTGAVPLALAQRKARFRARRLPELRHAPKVLRNLLACMLRQNPERRPQDPVLFEREIRECLTKVERRQAIRRKLGIPVAAIIPKPSRQELTPGPTAAMQILQATLVFVALLLTAAAVAAYLLPEGTIPFLHLSRVPNKIGVPVGVADPAAAASTTSLPVLAPASEAANQRASVAASQPATDSSSAPVASDPGSATIASTTRESEPEPPAEAQPERSASEEKPVGKQDSETSDLASSSGDKARDAGSNSKRTSRSRRAREANGSPNGYARSGSRRRRSGSIHATLLGTTADGRAILRLPSGHIIVVTPGAPDEELDARPRYRAIERPQIFVPPPQPFYPPGYPPYD